MTPFTITVHDRIAITPRPQNRYVEVEWLAAVADEVVLQRVGGRAEVESGYPINGTLPGQVFKLE